MKDWAARPHRGPEVARLRQCGPLRSARRRRHARDVRAPARRPAGALLRPAEGPADQPGRRGLERRDQVRRPDPRWLAARRSANCSPPGSRRTSTSSVDEEEAKRLPEKADGIAASPDVQRGDAIHRGDPVIVDRYTVAARINHWITAVSLVLLAISGLALFHPRLFFLTGLFGGGEMTRIIHPWIGVVMLVSFAGLFIRFWRVSTAGTGRTAPGSVGPREVLSGDEEKLPEVGKYNAGQKLYFWLMSISIVVYFASGIVTWQGVLRRQLRHRPEADRRAGACAGGDHRDLPSGSCTSTPRSGSAAPSAP